MKQNIYPKSCILPLPMLLFTFSFTNIEMRLLSIIVSLWNTMGSQSAFGTMEMSFNTFILIWNTTFGFKIYKYSNIKKKISDNIAEKMKHFVEGN